MSVASGKRSKASAGAARVNGHAALIVRSMNPRATRGVLQLGQQQLRCALGRSGRRAVKREGDGATPIGRWRLLEVYYRPGRVLRPQSRLPARVIRANDGWCDAPGDRNYNRRVRLPYSASAEVLQREDAVYDIVVVLDYNVRRRMQGAGSAIFLHLARPGYLPTAGCIALQERDLRVLLAHVGRRAAVVVPG